MNDAKNRLNQYEELYVQVKDKTTVAYLNLVDAMRMDYEFIKDYEHCLQACDEMLGLLISNEYGDEINEDEMFLRAFDSKARMGDFRSYCIALEWYRPIDKQFFLPRKKILEKHGLIQAFQDVADDKLDFLFVSLPPRIGKLLANDVQVLTKSGWKKHGDLQVGDYVLNDKGRFVRVLAVSDENLANCEITFSNGEKIQCHENHEWVVYDRHGGKLKTIETKEMIGKLRDTYKKNITKNHFRFVIPIKEPVLGEYKKLPIEPYSLGAWLGDGTYSKPCITIDKNDKIIAETIDKYYPIRHLYIHKTYGTYCYYFDNIKFDLQKEHMCHSRKKYAKHIPDIYFTASLEQRLELLAGLLDTDGSLVKKEHRYHFSTINPVLRDDFIKLVSTFGWRCSVSEYKPRLSTGDIQGKHTYWSIGFNPTFDIPCRLERKQLKEFSVQRRITITDIKYLENPVKGKCIQVEGGIYLAGKTLIPTHNSTLGLFFLSFMAGQYPERSILGTGHSTALVQSFYAELLNIMESEEYRYHQIFPTTRLANKSAEYLYLDLNNSKRFHTISFKSIEGGSTGIVEASNVLYCDDLIKDAEQASSRDRLDKLFEAYTSTIQDRSIQRLCKDGVYRRCPEIHVATRWSLNDPIGRLINIYSGEYSDRIRIINIPCYDENGESNFEYEYGKGFSKEYYHQLEMTEDPVVFRAKYLGEPIERDGLVFLKETLSFYNELPGAKPDRIVAYADVSHGGADYFSLPIGYVYGNEVYIEDILFENNFGGDDYIRPKVCQIIMKHGVQRFGIEKNNGGDFFATMISNDLKKLGYRCNITTHNAPTIKSKRDRILGCQNEIKGIATEDNTYRLYFKQQTPTSGNKMYEMAMKQLYDWNQNESKQKTQHDDMPDSLAGLITNVLGKTSSGAKSINASQYL
jgi:hypothetical protein